MEVAESPIIAAFDARKAFPGSKIVFETTKCDDPECSMYDMCHPSGLKDGERCTIVEVVGEAPEDCPRGNVLKLVEFRR